MGALFPEVKNAIKDIIYRNKLKRYVNKIVISSKKLDSLYGIPCLYIDNGIDLNSIPIKKERNKLDNNDIKLIAVSFIRDAVGYDRIIEGMNIYYKNDFKRKVILNIVGDGELELINKLKDKVLEYNLEEYVSFLGAKSGKDLDILFELSDIAVGSLGDHRLGVKSKSPLKSREYCARGIPFISSINDPGFKGNEEFILNIEPSDKPVNIESILDFYDELYSKNNISKEIREYAKEKFDWKALYKNFC